MNLSAHRINEIFASIKQGPNADEQLNEAEFGKAMQYLQNKNTDMALDFLGISAALLTISLIFLAIVLLLIFVFIFLGIQAFALGGTFGAVINSLLPMGTFAFFIVSCWRRSWIGWLEDRR
jgi:small-conductance mechanosensitive channel